MTVLILAREIEPHVDRLVNELARRDVPVFRTDLAAFPQSLTLDARLGRSGWEGTLATEHRAIRLGDIRSVWYRHPSHFSLADGMSRPEQRHAAAEARCGVGGVLSSLGVPWVNYPSREADALKPRQLAVARRCGLRVPESIVTNSVSAVREFSRGIGGDPLASKNLSAATVIESSRIHAAYTRRLEQSELSDLAGVDLTAHFFQRFVHKEYEVRATVVHDKVFAAAIHAGSDAARIDFRADYPSLDYAVVEPPEEVVTGMLAFMREFGLFFGAFDFAVTSDKQWIMFECNPFGQYGWLEDAIGLPITSALADLLANGGAAC